MPRARISRLHARGRAPTDADVHKRQWVAVSESSPARGPVDAHTVAPMLADELRLHQLAKGRWRADQRNGGAVAVDVPLRSTTQ